MTSNNEYQLMQRYVEGRMSPREQLGFEAQMREDAFLSDAVDGFTSDPGAFADMPRFGQASLSWLYIMAAGAIAILFAFWPSNRIHSDQIVNHNPTLFPLGNVLQNHIDIECEPLALVDINEVTEPYVALTPENQMVRAGENQMPESEKDEVIFIEAFMRPIEASEIEALSVKEIKDNVSLIYIWDLKIVKFSEKPMSLSSNIISNENHLPAAFEDSAPPISPLQARLAKRLTKANYAERLENALSAVIKEDYAKASKMISQLNKDFGQSINHDFYKGLCAYHLGDFTTSNKIFKSVEVNIIQSFRQEAIWYRALSLQAMGENELAESVFEEIYQADGHYAPMAASRLIGLKK